MWGQDDRDLDATIDPDATSGGGHGAGRMDEGGAVDVEVAERQHHEPPATSASGSKRRAKVRFSLYSFKSNDT